MHILIRRAFLLSLIFIIALQFSPTYALQKKSQQLVCLQAVRCDTAGSKCAGGLNSHRVYLTTDPHAPSRPNSKTFIVECISTSQGQMCTTGNADTSVDIGWNSHLDALKKATGYTFEGVFDSQKKEINQLTQSLVSDPHGNISPVEWQSKTDGPTYHTFYALNTFEAQSSSASSSATQKQSTFDLTVGNTACTSLRWDPYGVVFDGETLEPIPNTQVRLYQKNETNFLSASFDGVENPVTTKEDGVFNFVVPDGTYKLTVSNPNYFLLPTDLTKINLEYSKIYSDLYYATPDKSEITQTGKAQHRDIPLIPRQSGIGIYPIVVMDYYEYLDSAHATIVVKGRVSHPFAQIKIYTTPVGSTQKLRDLPLEYMADKQGLFTVELNPSTIEANEQFGGLEFQKKNLVAQKTATAVKSVNAQSSENTVSLPLEPILTDLNGFAYDAAGRLLPDAVVEIYLPSSNVPYSQTLSDATGHFRIIHTNLPSIPYTIRYRLNDKTVDVTTTKFLHQNIKYIESLGTNPLIPTHIPTSTPVPSLMPTKAAARNVIPPEQFQSGAYAFVVIIILVFGIIGVLVGFHLVEKH